MKYLYHVAVGPGLSYDCVGDDELALAQGDTVVLKCERYQDIGQVTGCPDPAPVDLADVEKRRLNQSRGRQVEGHRVPEIIRRASTEDLHQAADNEEKSASMQQQARERIAAHGLDMKLIHTHCSLDRRLAVLQFCAAGRVDFRELLRDLSHQFRTRVELRQVGVRDEAAIQGGIAACGRAFCCSTFLRQFKSINVKMAKIQGLSLNPNNISGACGRLKCCLEYEAELYREEYQKARSRAREANQSGRGDDGGQDSRRSDDRPVSAAAETERSREDRHPCQTGGRCPKQGGGDDVPPETEAPDEARREAPQEARQEARQEAPGDAAPVAGQQGPSQTAPSGDADRASGGSRRRRRPRRNRGRPASGESGSS